VTEETPVSKPKSAPKTLTTKSAPQSAPVAKKTTAAAVGEKKTSAAKSSTTKRVTATDTEKPTTTRRKTAADKTTVNGKPNPEERYHMVQAAAYFIAEKDGFQGCSVDYWLRAEQEIANRLGETAI
jgi:hypothetical protein